MNNALRDIVLKDIFHFVIRHHNDYAQTKQNDYAQTKQNVSAIRLTCHQWRDVIDQQIKQSIQLNFDNIFEKLFDSLMHNFDLPSYEHFFDRIVTRKKTNIIPVDRCKYCKKLRIVIQDRWCSSMVGCHRWICNERKNIEDDHNHVCSSDV
jgi:hypothetical protein